MPPDTLKRQRLDEPSLEELTDVQDPEIWMSDGNIIIAAVDEEKNERHVFKFYRGLLTDRLPVLRDMFEADLSSGSVGASVSERYDGTPVVRLYDDHADVQLLLGVLHDPTKLPYKWWRRETTNELSGLMRLARKYGAEDLLKHCTTVFRNAWPTTLQNWDRREEELARSWNEEEFEVGDHPPQYDYPEDPLNCNYPHGSAFYTPEPGAAIILASENELVKSCATAFYRLHCLYRPLLFYDYCDIPGRDMFPHELPVTIENLSAQQMRQFTDGREILRALPMSLFLALPDVMVTFRAKYDPLCCKDAIRVWCGEGRVWNAAERKHEDDPLGLLNELIKLLPNATPPPNNNNVCVSCRCSMQDWLELIREYIWENLPIYFGISGALPVHRNYEELKSRLRRFMKETKGDFW
ncbi:hypothetical protein BC629DRAFT_139719 [Irpex lacteus]|nr:hypothetical protein BC629DRAFT_139719 [Irpex lacteus]